MMDPNALMQMAQAFMGGSGRAPDQAGPRVTLALLAAVEDRNCSCAACGHLRAVVDALRASVEPARPPAGNAIPWSP